MEKLSTPYVGALVQKAVENGTIKLLGSANSLETAKKNAESDAAYLLTLMNKLTEGLTAA